MSMTVGEHKLPTIYDLPHVTEGIQPGAVIVNLNPREEFRKLYEEGQQVRTVRAVRSAKRPSGRRK